MIMQRHGKDCYQAVLSEITGINYEEIPEFYKIFTDENGEIISTEESNDKFAKAVDEWLDRHGYFRVVIFSELRDDGVALPYVSFSSYRCVGLLRRKDRTYDHAVVLEVDENCIVINDPKPNSGYDISDIVSVELIFKKGDPWQTEVY